MGQMNFAFGHELIVDLFAGGGGASLGIEQAFGRSVDIAVNHSADAIAMHEAMPAQNIKYPPGFDELDEFDQRFMEGDLLSAWWKRKKKIPAIHMPRWACRILLEVTAVRIERLQECSDEDAIAEGIQPFGDGGYHVEEGRFYMGNPVASYCTLWEHINGDDSWDANPWVWVITFNRVMP